MSDPNRRRFLSRTMATPLAAAAAAWSPTAGSSGFHNALAASEPDDAPESIANHCVFTKPLQSMTPAALASAVAGIGFGGTECPIRPGGMIEPENAADELPGHVAALAKQGLKITIATTAINDPDDPATETLLSLFAEHGITHYRMGYYRYDVDQPLPPQIDRWRGQLTDLAAMNRHYGLQGLYQNHANYQFFSGPIWDLYEAIRDIDPDDLGVAFDVRHATVEGTYAWKLHWRLIQDHTRAFFVKDFAWKNNEVINVPLGTGAVDADFYRRLDPVFKAMPFSLHQEYLDHKDASIVDQHLTALRQDYGVLKTWL